MTRRHVLRLGAWGALAAAAPLRALPSAARPRALAFYNTHTGERLRAVYWEQGAYLKSSLAEIDHHLRDHRTGDVKAIDPRLLELLYRLRGALDTQEPFHVISGYRSPATNAMLASRGGSVGKRSFHMRGMAIDVSLPGRSVADLRRAALAQQAGGVGYYPSSGFVHVDVGHVRSW
jgi:uncharacterized protein YcbK (DUF882 family)